MQPWSHLPNASRIDQLLTHAKANPKEWVVASDAAQRARSAALMAARDAARVAARVAAWEAAWDAAWDAVSDAVSDAAYYAAYYAAVALVAWDHSGSLLDLPSDQVLMLSKLGQPAAILMYPAVLAMSDKG